MSKTLKKPDETLSTVQPFEFTKEFSKAFISLLMELTKDFTKELIKESTY